MFNKFEKGKSAKSTLSELVFASSLPLETAIEVLSSLADEQHPITLTEVSPHKVEFEIEYLPQGTSLATVKGSLQRWNGIETKLDAKGDVIRLDSNETNPSGGGLSVGIIALTVIGSGLALAYGQEWMIFPIVFGTMGMSFYGMDSSAESRTSTIVLFRERDYLFQRLIDVFKSAGEVEGL